MARPRRIYTDAENKPLTEEEKELLENEEVTFLGKGQVWNKMTNSANIKFINGEYTTSDKSIIDYLLSLKYEVKK